MTLPYSLFYYHAILFEKLTDYVLQLSVPSFTIILHNKLPY